ncbi:MAG: proton-conducting transporter membrane subunit [Anaerolineales bacterium]
MDTILLLAPLFLLFAGIPLTLFLRKRRRMQLALALGVMLAALGFTLALLYAVLMSGKPVTVQLGNWPAPFGITFIADPLTVFMLLMAHLVLAAGFLYAAGSTEKVVQYPTFYPIFLALATGLTGALLTGDLFTLFVFAEVIVLSGAALTAIAGDRYGVEAAYKYFYISTLASAFFLMGIGSLYVSYGTLNIADLAVRIAENPSAPLTMAGLAFLTATFLIKGAVFPFHFWQPDFHAAAPTAISAMLSSIVVKLGVYGLLRLNTLLFAGQTNILPSLLVVLGVIGVIYGGFGAAGTHNAKRMLAYSTLAQIGFILVGIGWGTPLSLAAALVFTFNHALVKAAMLMLAGAIASRAAVKSASFEVVVGVGKYHPFAGVLFLLGGMALAGIPPLNGFISKLLIFWSGVQAEQYLPLAIIGVVSVMTLIYVFRSFIKIWFEPNPQAKPKAGDRLWAPAFLITLSLLLGVWPEPLVSLAQQVTGWLGDPSLYILSVLR